MIKIDRMEFPNRYKIRDISIIIVIVAAMFGIWLNGQSQRRLKEQVVISDVRITDFNNQAVYLDYRIENKGRSSRELKLLAKVSGPDGSELASALFIIEVPPHKVQERNKILDKLNYSLKEGEAPGKAEIIIYERRIF
ncbi:MAG TPA: hypothetical protein P5533_03295 [Candidatus Cloacimonadota bacterium]|nr:hypothetical protein [Candidatus Cloacimonadota bacterium]